MNDCTVPKMKYWRDTNVFAPFPLGVNKWQNVPNKWVPPRIRWVSSGAELHRQHENLIIIEDVILYSACVPNFEWSPQRFLWIISIKHAVTVLLLFIFHFLSQLHNGTHAPDKHNILLKEVGQRHFIFVGNVGKSLQVGGGGYIFFEGVNSVIFFFLVIAMLPLLEELE